MELELTRTHQKRGTDSKIGTWNQIGNHHNLNYK